MSKDKGTMLIETLPDGSEHENFFPDSKMAEIVLETRSNRFKKAGKTKTKPKDQPKVEKPKDAIPPDGPKAETKFTIEQLIELGKGSGGRPRLITMAKKFGVATGGKNEAIAQRIFDKALENSAKSKSDAE